MEKRTFRNKAFLSYRHVKRDGKLAALLQEKLEHYRISRGLQGGRIRSRGVGRIFRDTTDLGARADLTEELRRELDESEYLIVLCSEAAIGSKWIEREIRYFLQSHNVDRILPVLADGEPEEVLPALFSGIEGMPQHPVACDFRGNRRQALREELPRLAAALLDCPYDELINRRHRFETRRMAAVTAALPADVPRRGPSPGRPTGRPSRGTSRMTGLLTDGQEKQDVQSASTSVTELA